MLTYCGSNSRITIAKNAGANRFSVIHKLWDDVTSLDLTAKPKLNQRLLFAAATGSFDLCPPGAFFKLGSMEEQDAFLASREIIQLGISPIYYYSQNRACGTS